MPLPEYIPYQRKSRWGKLLLISIPVLMLVGFLVLQVPRVNRAVFWRLKILITYVGSIFEPVGKLPTPSVSNEIMSATALPTDLPEQPTSTVESLISQTQAITPEPSSQATPLPGKASINPAPYDPIRDKEDFNNCGPATLALALRIYGWSGDQYTISKVIKPNRDDSNVNVEELIYYVKNQATALNATFRVGGNLDSLRKFLANGIPVIIEETYTTDRQYLVNDDRWSGHYLLITGFDDYAQQVIAQDVILGPNQVISYGVLEQHWQSFNHVYIPIFRMDQTDFVKGLLGVDADPAANRRNALADAQKVTMNDSQNAFAWFNVGSNLVALDRYPEAARAYDKAREIGLPMRMLRYQFGPFMAYFHGGRIDDLLALTKYALSITRVSEEAMLWRGWAFYRTGDKTAALTYFRNALDIHPGYGDAQYAIDYVNTH